MSDEYELKFLKLENERLKIQLKQQDQQDQQVDLNEIKELVELASEMRQVLISCRKEQINISIAKKIDNVLNRAKNFD